jgi:hypothetical protein
MRTLLFARRATGLSIVLALVATLSLHAQRRGRNDNSSFGAPIATNTLADNPAPYFGKVVTISAGVEEVLSTTAFVVDQRKMVGPTAVKAIGKPILVIAPYMTSALDHKNYLLMRGEVIKLDSLAIARMASEYKVDLAQAVTEKYQGLPVLLATSVLNSTYTELARKPIPPPTAADVSLTSAMKTISPAFTALRTAADMSKTDAVTENLAKLKPAFMQAESIFGDLKQPSAAARAREASSHVASIESALAAGNWDAVKTSAGALNQTCQNCHAASRERQEDGTFRLKLEPTAR